MRCRICDSTLVERVVDLGMQPWANQFLKADEVGKEASYPLRVVYCLDCSGVQLDYTVPKEVMFSNHTYLSGVTRSLSQHFSEVARRVDDRFFKDRVSKAVLDIGSNDGTQLKHFKELGYDVLGVESSKTTAAVADKNGVRTLNLFFNFDLASRLNRKFEVINAAGVFFHLEELHSVTAGIRECLKPGGVFVVQFLYMKNIVENCAFDQIYHEHLLYYTLKTIEALLKRHDLALFDAYLSPVHGGSVIAYVGHAGERSQSTQLEKMQKLERETGCNEIDFYRDFQMRIENMKRDNLSYLRLAKKSKKRVFGMGAPVKGNTLLNYFGIGTDTVSCLVEKNRLRKGLFSPGSHIPIVLENELDSPPDIYYVLAWNFKDEIIENNAELIEKGVEFYFPVNPLRIQTL